MVKYNKNVFMEDTGVYICVFCQYYYYLFLWETYWDSKIMFYQRLCLHQTCSYKRKALQTQWDKAIIKKAPSKRSQLCHTNLCSSILFLRGAVASFIHLSITSTLMEKGMRAYTAQTRGKKCFIPQWTLKLCCAYWTVTQEYRTSQSPEWFQHITWHSRWDASCKH